MCILTLAVHVSLAIAGTRDPMVHRRDDSQVVRRTDETLTRARRCYSRIPQVVVKPVYRESECEREKKRLALILAQSFLQVYIYCFSQLQAHDIYTRLSSSKQSKPLEFGKFVSRAIIGIVVRAHRTRESRRRLKAKIRELSWENCFCESLGEKRFEQESMALIIENF